MFVSTEIGGPIAFAGAFIFIALSAREIKISMDTAVINRRPQKG